MKVLLALEATLGGTSRHVLDLAEGLLDRGIEVHLVYSRLRSDRGFRTGLTSLSTSWPIFHSQEIPITREVTFSDFSSYLRLRRYVRRHGPFDVIHAHSTKAGFLSRLLSRSAIMIYTPHALMTMSPQLGGFRRRAVCALERVLARRSDSVVVVSENERACALETGIEPAKLTVIPNGIRGVAVEAQLKQRDSVRRSLGISLNTVLIGFVGRLCYQKEPDRLVEAFSFLKRQVDQPVCLAIIGSGALEPELRALVAQLDLSEDVRFLGEVDGASHMSAFDILALTSHYEAFGYVLVEALSAGVPIVTTRVGAADELIENGITGYICDPWDPQTFASYLRLLIDDPARRAAMAAKARERAAPYSTSNMVDSITQLYARLFAVPNPEPVVSTQYSR